MTQANFGEALTTWYLRLNGFFPLPNFVLHQGEVVGRSGDCDIIAVRLPGVFEEIGGQPADWDIALMEQAGLSFAEDTIGVVVEVKTGYVANPGQLPYRIRDAFREEKLRYAVPRLGIWNAQYVYERVIPVLAGSPFFAEPSPSGAGRLAVAKLFVGSHLPPPQEAPPCLLLDLSAIDAFLHRRFTDYRFRKVADRMFFPSELIQYVIWKCAA
jgi:hypothetical protein